MAVAESQRMGDTRYGPNSTERARAESPQEETSEKVVATAFAVDAAASAGAVVLAILGLAGIYPSYMAPIAVLAIAGAMLVKSGGVASRFPQLQRHTGRGIGPIVELGGGVTAELLAGAAGIALGVLALLGVAPATLIEVAVIVFGGALLLGGGETFRVSHLGPTGPREDTTEYYSRLTAESAGSGESLVGIAAVVLGILALSGLQSGTLVLVALLSLGGAMLLSGAAVGTRLFAALR